MFILQFNIKYMQYASDRNRGFFFFRSFLAFCFFQILMMFQFKFQNFMHAKTHLSFWIFNTKITSTDSFSLKWQFYLCMKKTLNTFNSNFNASYNLFSHCVFLKHNHLFELQTVYVNHCTKNNSDSCSKDTLLFHQSSIHSRTEVVFSIISKWS